MSKKSQRNGNSEFRADNGAEAREFFSMVTLDENTLIEEGVKESRVNGSWQRKQAGKNRDASRREMRREHNVNRRKSSR